MPLSEEAQALIAEEEETLASVLESLKQQRYRVVDRINNEGARANELAEGRNSFARAEDQEQFASDERVSSTLRDSATRELTAIDKLLQKPYFARVVLEEEIGEKTKRIEYKIGTSSNLDCRIIDWKRAPLAKLYYEYAEGEDYFDEIQGRDRSGKILRKTKLEIDGGELKRIRSSLGTFSKENGTWIEGGVSSERGSYGSLPPILSLITKEQYQLITEEAKTPVFIQGVAGSGKTTVALYRLAWLVSEQGLSLDPAKCLILVPSRALEMYVRRSLDDLSLHGTTVKRYQDWIAECFAKENSLHLGGGVDRPEEDTPPGIARVKTSLAMIAALEEYVQNQALRAREWLEKKGVVIDTLLKRRLSALGATEPLLPFLAAVVASLPQGTTREELETLKKRCSLFHQDIATVLSRPQNLLSHDTTRLLDAELVKEARDHTELNFVEDKIAHEDDALLLYLHALKMGRPSETYQHIVVDELQDAAASSLAFTLRASTEPEHITLVGDSYQHTSSRTIFPGWDKLRHFFALDDSISKFVTLSVSHRSTVSIMRLADFVQGRRQHREGRQGRRPLWFHCPNENEGTRRVLTWLEQVLERYPGTLATVITADDGEASYVESLLEPTFGMAVRKGDDEEFSFDEGILVAAAEHVKGLEFPHVLIWNPSRQSYGEDEKSRSKLYVAITRAEEHLGLVTWQKPSKLLPHIHSKIIRGHDLTEPDE